MSDHLFIGTIKSFVRSECIGFQRGSEGLTAVIELLVQPEDGPLTTVYQIQTNDEHGRQYLRHRPRIDIPAPQRRPSTWNEE